MPAASAAIKGALAGRVRGMLSRHRTASKPSSTWLLTHTRDSAKAGARGFHDAAAQDTSHLVLAMSARAYQEGFSLVLAT
jgi:hypothetical protein